MKKNLRTACASLLSILLLFAASSSKAQNRNNKPGKLPVAYGAFSTKDDLDYRLVAANNLGVYIVRQTQYLSYWSGDKSPGIDYWNTRKKQIVVNINNDTTPSYFPKDLSVYKNKLRSFLEVYGDSIKLAVIENEELNDGKTGARYHLGSMQDYIDELSAAVNICNKRKIPVTDGGLTMPVITSLKHYYIINNKPDSARWLVQQMNGVPDDSIQWMRTDSLLNAFKIIPLTYVNLHWYEPMKDLDRMSGVLQVVCNYITQQTGKKVITNETGIKSDSSFVPLLLKQWDSIQPAFCIFFDGLGSNDGLPLTSETGSLLSAGIAFRDYVAGVNSCHKSINITPSGFINACYGDNLALTASGGFRKYQWNTGDTGLSIVVKATGNYAVTAHNKDCIVFSNSVQVLMNALPAKPVITTDPSPPHDLCPNMNVKLFSSIAPTHLWNTGDTTKNININHHGKYFVTISDSNGCKRTSEKVKVTYQKCRAPSHLSVTGIETTKATLTWDTVPCAVGYQVQYRIKDRIAWTTVQVVSNVSSSRTIFGLTAAVYEWRMLTYCRYTQDTIKGAYTNGPEFTIPPSLVVSFSVAKNTSGFEATIFPSPAKSVATVYVNHASNDLKITLIDVYGKVLWQTEKIAGDKVQLPVAGLASGIYLIVVENKKSRETLRLIKQ